MNIVVIGKNGQLAQELSALSLPDTSIICFGRNDIDLQDSVSMRSLLTELDAKAVVNTSAYTAVDNAESNTDEAYKLNFHAVKNIAKSCSDIGMHLVHVSTDFVFDGSKSSPYLTKDKCNPINVYGRSKREGEKVLLLNYTNRSCIIRTSWVYSIYGGNFVKSMLNLMGCKEKLGIVSDQIGSPTSARDLALACVLAAKSKLTGIHHWTDLGVASWYDFAVAIQEIALGNGLLEKEIPIIPITTQEYPTPAKRPSYSVLDKTSCTVNFSGLRSNHWRKQLNLMLNMLSLTLNKK